MATKQKITLSIQIPEHRDQFLLHKKAKKGNEKGKAVNTITQNEPGTETDLI